MMEISNYGIMDLADPARRPSTAAGLSAVQDTKNMLPSQVKPAAAQKAEKTSFTPTEAVQKEATKWESFAAETFDAMKVEMTYHNHLLNHDDAYWAQKAEIMGAEYVAISKQYVKERTAATEGNLAEMQRGLVDNDFVISGTIYQKNDAGEFEFGDFKVSKTGLGYKLQFDGPEESEVDYHPPWSSRGQNHVSMLNNDILSVLFRERR